MKTEIFVSLFALSILSACNPIKGDLQIDGALTLNTKETIIKGNPYCLPAEEREGRCQSEEKIEKKVTKVLNPGVYSSELNIVSKSKLSLNISVDKVTQTVDFVLPDGMTVPSFAGEFTLTPQQSGQIYSVRGSVDTDVTESSRTTGYDSCTYLEYERVCRPAQYDPNRRDHRGGGGEVCRDELVTRFGTQYVEYHYRYETKNVAITLFDVASTVATFRGSQTSSDRINDYEGPCMRRY